jgi:hypothetical protein
MSGFVRPDAKTIQGFLPTGEPRDINLNDG